MKLNTSDLSAFGYWIYSLSGDKYKQAIRVVQAAYEEKHWYKALTGRLLVPEHLINELSIVTDCQVSDLFDDRLGHRPKRQYQEPGPYLGLKIKGVSKHSPIKKGHYSGVYSDLNSFLKTRLTYAEYMLLPDVLGMNNSEIKYMLNGTLTPDFTTLVALAEFCKIKIGTLENSFFIHVKKQRV